MMKDYKWVMMMMAMMVDDDDDDDDDNDDDDDDDIQVLPVGLFSYLFLTRSNRKHVQR